MKRPIHRFERIFGTNVWCDNKFRRKYRLIEPEEGGGTCKEIRTISDLVSRCRDILKENRNNRACKYAVEYLQDETGKYLKGKEFEIFLRIVKSGVENPDSSIGCYAMTPNDYSTFQYFFDKVIRDYHGDLTGKKIHETDWDVGSEKDRFDLQKLGLGNDTSMRVRVARNLIGFNLPGAMEREERIVLEQTLLRVFDELKTNYGGRVYSLTPKFGPSGKNDNLISKDLYEELVDGHVMFKDMSSDPYLNSAGISNDWPYGRGCWQSEDKTRIVWFGEEDQLRIMTMQRGSNLIDVFSKLNEILATIESIGAVTFAKHEKYGYITSCPSNLGTAMRASVHVKVPKLTAGGSDVKVKAICKPLNLSVRGVGGEHTPIGVDGTVDISPSSRLFVKENQIIDMLYKGIERLMDAENNLKA